MFFVESWKLHAHDSAIEFLIRSLQNRRILLKFFTEDLIDQLYSHDVKSTMYCDHEWDLDKTHEQKLNEDHVIRSEF